MSRANITLLLSICLAALGCGRGGAPAEARISADPASVDLGSHGEGTRAFGSVTLSNPGSTLLVFDDVSIDGDLRGAYTLSSFPDPLAPDAGVALRFVYLAPPTPGDDPATLTITSSAADHPTLQIPLLAHSICIAETDAAFCAHYDKQCSTYSDLDNCGAARTVTSCGECSLPEICNGQGTPNACAVPPPPANLTYSSASLACTLGVPCGLPAPSVQGGPVFAYSSAALPPGLALDTLSGAISGTPSALSPAASYSISASNSGGASSFNLQIAVDDVPPSALTYPAASLTCTLGQPCALAAPSSRGGAVVAYSVSPLLPAGLVLDTASGAIAGAPAGLSPLATYSITASNSGGSTQTALGIAVVDVPPSSLSYSAALLCTLGRPCASVAPVHQGGAVTSYTANSALPAGLALDPATGVVSGTPAALAPQADDSITASNSGGQTSALLSVTVQDVAPGALTYSPSALTCTLGVPCRLEAPAQPGGVVVGYSITPALPAGLSLDGHTGVLSGTPQTLFPSATFTVTASNSGGQGSGVFSLTVADLPPSALTYSPADLVCTRDQACALSAPASAGGPIVTYSIDRKLPAGMAFEAGTGILSGTPSVLWPGKPYEVTASNSGGATTGNFTLTVNDIPPSALTYSASALICTRGQPCALGAPAAQGGPILSYSIAPALPAGLSFSSATGAISGAATALAPSAGYQVTASNTGGAATANLSVAVNDAAPAGLAYFPASMSCTVRLPCAIGGPSGAGGAPTLYSLQSSLPAGLSLDPIRGAISGTPLAAGSAAALIGASNSGGSTTISLNISIGPSAIVDGASGAIATGGLHSCALLDGGAFCWGDNSRGQLGDNSTVDSPIPVAVAGLSSGVQAIAAGAWSSCAVVNGAVLCWGYNAYGQLGINSTSSSLTPVAVTNLSSGAQALAVGSDHACALVNNGVQCWGYNGDGELGNTSAGANPASLVPVAVSGLTAGVQAIAAGDYHSCALLNGVIQCWGLNNSGQLGNNTTVSTNGSTPVRASLINSGAQAIAAGGSASCALINGGAQCWGGNSNGQLGNNSTASSLVPVAVSGLTRGVQAIAAGESSACAIAGGGLFCWGANNLGQLGGGAASSSAVPIQVSGLSGAQAISAGGGHACAMAGGAVSCWGSDSSGQTGNQLLEESAPPALVISASRGVQAVAVGGDGDACALVDGDIECWGNGGSGQLGLGSTLDSYLPAGSALPATASSISLGFDSAYAVVQGAAWSWGANDQGQLGIGNTTASLSPAAISALTSGVQAIAAGDLSACAMINGAVQCWGLNSSGQLGNNTTVNATSPVQVTNLTASAEAISAGQGHYCALVNGAAQCWGLNGSGQLGNNSTTNAKVPVAVTSLTTNVSAIATGLNHSCALAGGGVQCWGLNGSGQLGNNATANSLVAVAALPAGSGVQAIAAGGNDTCALINGGVKCWGDNSSGQLGNNSTVSSPMPASVGNLSGVLSISVGNNEICALLNAGVVCWGSNAHGALGDDSTASSPIPTPVLQLFGSGN